MVLWMMPAAAAAAAAVACRRGLPGTKGPLAPEEAAAVVEVVEQEELGDVSVAVVGLLA